MKTLQGICLLWVDSNSQVTLEEHWRALYSREKRLHKRLLALQNGLGALWEPSAPGATKGSTQALETGSKMAASLHDSGSRFSGLLEPL